MWRIFGIVATFLGLVFVCRTKSRLGWPEPAVQQAPEDVCLLGKSKHQSKQASLPLLTPSGTSQALVHEFTSAPLFRRSGTARPHRWPSACCALGRDRFADPDPVRGLDHFLKLSPLRGLAKLVAVHRRGKPALR